jgi:LPXTG-site transpeptidase (sortase) family protein
MEAIKKAPAKTDAAPRTTKPVMRRSAEKLVPGFMTVLVVLSLMLQFALPARAQAALSITPVTWNVVGLDGSSLTQGPNTFLVGARVCSQNAPASNLIVRFIWDADDPSPISLASPVELTLPSLAANACQDFYFTITVAREAASINAARAYRITAQADGVSAVSTPTPREIYVENLAQRQELSTSQISGPTSVVVGQTFTYTVISSTGEDEYQQLVHSLLLPSNVLRLLSASAEYSNPSDFTNPGMYADACGWIADPSSPSYLTCGPTANPSYPDGVVSGVITTTFQVQVIAAGSATITPLLYGYTGESYVYAGDFGQDTLSITAAEPTPTLSPTTPSAGDPTETPTPTDTNTPVYAYLPGVGKVYAANPTITGTPTNTPTPTATGTINPTIHTTKSVSSTQVNRGSTFTFTVRVLNTGTAPAAEIRVTDNINAYSSYLRITGVTTDKGTATFTNILATVDIPTLLPNESANITITVQVLNTMTGTAQPCNMANITFTGGVFTTPIARNSSQICFRVVGTTGGVLPGTGEISIESAAAASAARTVLMVVSAGLGLAGLVALWFALKATGKEGGKSLALLTAAVVLGSGSALVYLMASGSLSDLNVTDPEPKPVLVAEIELEPAGFQPSIEASATRNPLAVAPPYIFSTPDPAPYKTLPVFAIPSPTLAATPGPEEKVPDTSPIRWMSIPSLGMANAKVAYVPFEGNTWLIEGLREEIAWMGDTSWPGLGGNTGLAAHVTVRGLGNGPFRYISDLVSGDAIVLYTEKNIYTYAVQDKKVVADTDLSVIEQEGDARVTLITCINWSEELHDYLDRLVVTANLVKVEPIGVSSK